MSDQTGSDERRAVDRRKLLAAAAGGAAVTAGLLASDSARSARGSVPVQYVEPVHGNDQNDGLGWRLPQGGREGPKQTIRRAIEALPVGGVVFLAAGDYLPDQTLRPNGHHLVGFAPRSIRNPDVRPLRSPTTPQVTITHRFDGPLFEFEGGGSLKGLSLSNANAAFNSGPAIHAVSTADSPGGYIYVEDVVVTSPAHGWERAVVLDGSSDPDGLRSTFFTSCQFFGARVPGETIVLNRCINSFWSNCEIVPAPLDAARFRQGMKIQHAATEEVYLSSCYIEGDLYSEAAGAGGGQSVHVGNSRIKHDVTLGAGAANNRIDAAIGGTVTNSGAPTNVVQEPRWTALELKNGWTNFGESTPRAEWARDLSGFVTVRGAIKAPASGPVDPVVATLPLGTRPLAQEAFAVPAGAATSRVDVVPGGEPPGGDIRLQQPLRNGSYLSLSGIRFSVL